MATLVTWQCPKCLTDNRDNVHASGKYQPTCGECEMRMPSRVMTGTVTEVEPRGQTVAIDADDYGADRHLAIRAPVCGMGASCTLRSMFLIAGPCWKVE